MKFEELVRPGVHQQPTYEPGRPIEAVAHDFGLDPQNVAKLASNENPLGPSPRAMEAAQAALHQVRLYPDGGANRLIAKIAEQRGIDPGMVVLGNGSNEIIELLGHAFLGEGDEVIMGEHAFIVYQLVARLFGAKPIEVPMPGLTHDLKAMRAAITPRTRLIFLPSPNNPTGTVNTASEINAFVRELPEHVVFCFDEAYAEYLAEPPDLLPLIKEGYKVICLRTFSKIHGLAGLRVGYGYADPGLIALLQRVRQPFNINLVAQAAALAALEDEAWVRHCRDENATGLARLEAGLKELGLEVIPSQANFILARFPDAKKAFTELQQRGLVVRPVGVYGLPEWLRISVGTAAENTRLLEALQTLKHKVGLEASCS